MDCKTCIEMREKQAQEEREKQAQPVPFTAHEKDMARLERSNRRLWILVIILVLALVCMFIYEAQFETVTTTVSATQESDTGNNYATGGDYYGGTPDSNNYYNSPSAKDGR